MGSWTWEEYTDLPDVGDVKDIDLAIKLGICEDIRIVQDLTGILIKSCPSSGTYTSEWLTEKDTTGSPVPVISIICRRERSEPIIELLFGLNKDQNGDLVLLAGFLRIHVDYRRMGIAKALLRDVLSFCDKYNIRQVSLSANIDEGAYVWARLGARPVQIVKTQKCLQERLKYLIGEGEADASDLLLLKTLIKSSDDASFMYKLATMTNNDHEIGKKILLSVKPCRMCWEAVWCLDEEVCREICEKEIGNG